MVKGRGIRDTREHDLGPVVVDDCRGASTVAHLDLRQVLPHGDQLDAVAGGRGGQAVQVGQRCHVGRLVEHDQQGRV